MGDVVTMGEHTDMSDRNDRLARRNLYDELIALRDAQREQRSTALTVIRGKELPQERNRQGLFEWYLHPLLDDTVINTEIFARQEIPPGSRSGRQRYQGGQVIFVLEGRGYTLIDEVKHTWKKGDLVTLPLKVDGIVYQHVNTDDENPARLLVVEPNLVHTVGVDRGCGFEQLDDCPEYEAGHP
jgi:quercetin dioxygenase-like cupin family protein